MAVRRHRWPVVLVIVGLWLLLTPPVGSAESRDLGPELMISGPVAARAIACRGGLVHEDRPVVLLIPGTGLTGTESFADGFGPLLAAAGFDWCTVEFPDLGLGDVYGNVEFVVSAVRTLTERTGHQVSLVGRSQGAIHARAAVRWWPDLRDRVDAVVTVAGANQGLALASARCGVAPCYPVTWQLNPDSRFMLALNNRPIPAGPTYAAIGSVDDLVINPGRVPGETAPYFIRGLGRANVLVQDLCPGRSVGHMATLFDPIVAAIVLDVPSHRAVFGADAGAGRCATAGGPDVTRAAATLAASMVRQSDPFDPRLVSIEPSSPEYVRD
ncbi:hypothetical protein GV794_06135 [Nocardia cyriacigeorgica]|uniref:Lipase n=1 Tax=Nocardia cyriacigeorgica TaxID=135487 RepID=A0ABX0CF95_9NOCA|nr:hypothetical protein [Nocardia cyriacigeorgica]NEW55238.1 hypothetical protein [Nocardia cyriacigeorgica]